MKMPFLLKLIISIGICLCIGFIGALFTTPNIESWYTTLEKPSFTPPNTIFGPVWTMLFILMGISFALVWKKFKTTKAVSIAMFFFLIQLAFNLLWSFLFFSAHSPFLALIDIVILWILIFITITRFARINAVASYLLMPYLLWVTFATILNTAIVILNS